MHREYARESIKALKGIRVGNIIIRETSGRESVTVPF